MWWTAPAPGIEVPSARPKRRESQTQGSEAAGISTEPLPAEQVVDDRYERHRANWNKVPVEIRKCCLDALRAEISPELLAEWKTRYRSGEKFVGHLGNGVFVRNVLRRQLRDGELPPVIYPGGFPTTNWDDYYLGALQELVEETDA
jgi:hypothetical protein